MATSPSLRNTPLRPDDWVQAAFARLAKEGIDSVRVEVLARDLGVSKGSFYWHFTDRDDLLARMLVTWHKSELEWLFAHESRGDAGPATRWASLVERNSELSAMCAENAIRAWARRNEQVAIQLSDIERRKRILIAEILCDIGFAKEAADRWGEIVLLICQGWADRRTRNGESFESHESLGSILSELVLAASANA